MDARSNQSVAAGNSHVLLVDDDAELCELLAEYLRRQNFRVSLAHNGPDGLKKARTEDVDIILLDIMLPGMSGIDVLRELRRDSQLPVLMLTAMGDTSDRVIGLELGADDYLPKPADPRELCARIRAVLRRGEGGRGGNRLQVGDIVLDPACRKVYRDGQSISLTSTEFSLLQVLLSEAGSVVSKDELYRRVLGREAAAFDRAIDMHISNIRRKLGPASDTEERIETIRGSGYQWLLPDSGEIPPTPDHE